MKLFLFLHSRSRLAMASQYMIKQCQCFGVSKSWKLLHQPRLLARLLYVRFYDLTLSQSCRFYCPLKASKLVYAFADILKEQREGRVQLQYPPEIPLELRQRFKTDSLDFSSTKTNLLSELILFVVTSCKSKTDNHTCELVKLVWYQIVIILLFYWT